jgi:hypothetical protein
MSYFQSRKHGCSILPRHRKAKAAGDETGQREHGNKGREYELTPRSSREGAKQAPIG